MIAAAIPGISLIILTAEGIEKRLALPHAAGPLQRMDEGWLAAPPFAIRLTGDGAATPQARASHRTMARETRSSSAARSRRPLAMTQVQCAVPAALANAM